MTAKLVDQFVFVSLLVLAALLAVSGLDKLSALAQVISIMRHEGLFDALMRIEAFVALLGCWECFLAASLLMRSFSAWTLGLTLITFLGFICYLAGSLLRNASTCPCMADSYALGAPTMLMLDTAFAVLLATALCRRRSVSNIKSSRLPHSAPAFVSVTLVAGCALLNMLTSPAVVTVAQEGGVPGAEIGTSSLYRLKIHNLGQKELLLIGIRSSCGATAVAFTPVEIAVGDHAEVSVRMSAKNNMFRRDALRLMTANDNVLREKTVAFYR